LLVSGNETQANKRGADRLNQSGAKPVGRED